jgi:hypothetical protein
MGVIEDCNDDNEGNRIGAGKLWVYLVLLDTRRSP